MAATFHMAWKMGKFKIGKAYIRSIKKFEMTMKNIVLFNDKPRDSVYIHFIM